jgi:hypothetical protein
VTTTEGSNAVERVFRPGKRTAVDQLAMMFEGSFAVQFTLVNPWWLRTILGSPSQSGSGPDYTYDYADGDVETIQIIEGHEQSGKERVLSGCFATRAQVEVNVEEEVTVTLEGAYADESINDPATLTAQTKATDTYDPLTFAEGSIDVDGTTESYVQSMTLTVENNVDPVREMGSRIIADFNPKVLAPSVDFTELFDGDHTNTESLYGGTGDTTPQEDADDNKVAVDMKFDNGKSSGSGQNTGTFTVTGTLTDSYDEGGIGDPRADLEETINRMGENFTASWTNEENTEPI